MTASRWASSRPRSWMASNSGYWADLAENGLQTRVLSVQTSSFAEIRASKAEKTTKQGVSTPKRPCRQVKDQDHRWPQNAGFRHIWPKNGLQTRVLSIQASSSAEIRASKPENAIKQGVSTLQVRAILKDFKGEAAFARNASARL